MPEYQEKVRTNSYSLKISSNLSQNHSLSFSTFGGPTYRPLGVQGQWQLESAVDPKMSESEWRLGSNNQVLRWNGTFGSNMFIEAQVARAYNQFTIIPTSLSEGIPKILDQTVDPWLDIGGFGGDFNNESTNLQYSMKFTNLWRNHQFRYGVQLQDISFSQFNVRTGGTFVFPDGTVATHGYMVAIRWCGEGYDCEKLWRVSAFPDGIHTDTNSKYLDWFVQDSWTINPNLNLTLGIRWEQQDFKLEQGDSGFRLGNNWAPRIGATYDYLKNGKSKAYAHFGRYFERLPNLEISRMNKFGSIRYDYFDAELTKPIPDTGTPGIIPYSGGGAYSEVEGIWNSSSPFKTKAGYTDEWSGGIEQEIKPGFSLGAGVIFRKLGRVVEPIRINLDSPCVPTSDGGCVQPGFTLEDLGSRFLGILTNVDGHTPGYPAFVRDYKALQITADERLSDRWQLMGSYRYAQLIGNYEGQDRSAAGDFADSPSVHFNYEVGPLPNDIRHMIKIFSSYQILKNLDTGISFYFQTGHPIRKLALYGGFPHASTVLLSSRESMTRTDPQSSVDLHAEYALTFGKSQQITFGFDLFNLFNSYAVTDVDETFVQYDDPVTPNFNDFYGFPFASQEPRSIRMLLRYSF